MPTHEETAQFWRDWARLSAKERQPFREAVEKFAEDLESLHKGQFRRGLRVKPMQDAGGVFEMTWDLEDGRATFEYGQELRKNDPHIIWRRVGGHQIFVRP